jgi:hypothetical protein
MENLRQLLYTSFIAPDIDGAAIRQIVRHGREKNRRLGITSLLVFDGLRVCHYLEGPGDALQSLVAIVRADLRHIEFAIREQTRLVGSRLFPSWALGFAPTRQPEDLNPLFELDAKRRLSAVALLERLLPSLAVEP